MPARPSGCILAVILCGGAICQTPASPAAPGVDITGQWHATVTLDGRTSGCAFDLRQDGTAITGTMRIEDRLLPIDKGAIHGGTISLSVRVPLRGRLAGMPIEGRLDGALLRLRLDDIEIVASRVQRTRESARLERLSGLFRLWGAIHFFHPDVAHGNVDWDAALLAAIPGVDAATTAAEYGAAVDAMLGVLKDPETHVLRGSSSNSAASGDKRQRLVRSGYWPQVGSSMGGGYYVDWEPAGSGTYEMSLPDAIHAVMRTSEPASSRAVISSSEKTYGDSLPPRGQRLLALARLWNTIHYFYGYPENIPSWDKELPSFIPVFESTSSWRDYVFAIGRLAARTHDSHTSIPAFWREMGEIPAVDVLPVDGQSVIKDAAPGLDGIERGDIITAVDGKPVERLRKELLEMYPYSTPQAAWLRINRFLLAGKAPSVRMRVIKADGTELEVTAPRTGPLDLHRRTPVYGILPAGYGYIDLERLEAKQIDTAFAALMKTPGLILDMRGYPKDSLTGVASRLAAETRPATLIRRRTWHGPDPALAAFEQTEQLVHPDSKPKYTGRVVVLIDARAVSAAEHLCLLLEAAVHPAFVGTPTNGADGEVTNIILPGSIQVNFAALEVRHADGRPLQNTGILPDVWAAPTIEGIRQGRDEVLEKAVEFLKLSGRGEAHASSVFTTVPATSVRRKSRP